MKQLLIKEACNSTLSAPPKPKPAYKNADRATYFRDEVTGEKYYKCPYCLKHLKGHLTIHLRTHTGLKPWKCKKCGKMFSQKCNLQSHMKSVHATEKPFKCELCPKSFGYKKNLERHVNAHLLERPYKCSFCSRRFSSVDYLCKHKRLHTGETPYDCIFCQKKMSQYLQMMNHVRRHIQERSYLCQFCDKSFFTGSCLGHHVKANHLKRTKRVEEYKCIEDTCKKVFKFKNSSIRHWHRHHVPENERPYFCVFCERGFAGHSFLRDHLARHHTKERPEECSICYERFFCKSSLRSHKIRCNNAKRDERSNNCKCKVCGKECTSKNRLLNHFLWKHTGYEVVNLTRV